MRKATIERKTTETAVSASVALDGTGAYRIDALEAEAIAVFTNTNPVGAYRGAARP